MLLNRLPLHVLPPRAVLLAGDVALLILPDADGAAQRLLDGVEPPFGTVEVTLSTGSARLAALRLGSRFVDFHEQAISFVGGDQRDGQHSIVLGTRLDELAQDLDLPSRRRVLGFLLGFCRKAFDLAGDVEFVAGCRQLVAHCGCAVGTARLAATVTSSWSVLDMQLPDTDRSAYLVGAAGIRRTRCIGLAPVHGKTIVERAHADDLLLTIGDHPSAWLVAPAERTAPDLIRPRPGAAALRAACLRALSPLSPQIAAAIHEMALFSPAAPVRIDDVRRPVGCALEAALPDGEGGIFLRGWLRDPLDLVRTAELVGPHGTVPVELSALHRFRRPDIEQHYAGSTISSAELRTGFVAHVPDPAAGLDPQPILALHLHSGSKLQVRPPLRRATPAVGRGAVLASVPPSEVTELMLDGCLGPATAAFHRAALAQPRKPEIVEIGRVTPDPTTSIVIPLYRNLSFLRFQLAAFARDHELARAELTFVLDSPEQRGEAEHLLRGLNALYALPLTLLVMPGNMGYAAANNVGAARARSPELLLLNSDVVPTGPGWLGPLRAALQLPGVGAVGPKLLFDDGSVQHAGLYFDQDLEGVWFNAHYDKGMPRHWPGAAVARSVPGVTGAALLVRRNLFEQVGGICEDYVIGDYEDSDFCLRLREAGADIRYEPASELFHFERRSIELHKGYTGTLASRYNRCLHHRRWAPAMQALMLAAEAAR